ncbi:MAG: 30S ribosome-binding factor RbfA [Steroidobacteraceae bacterium]
MPGARHQRIESEMRREIAELVSREVKDPRVGKVTITEVSLNKDLSSARVFCVPFAAKGPPEAVLEGLNNAAGFLRGEVGRRLRLRHAPRLTFILDETIDHAAHLTALIDSAIKRES